MYCNTKTLTADSKKSAGDPDYDALNDGLNTWKDWNDADSVGLFNDPMSVPSWATQNRTN